jgi:hypothetical protein
LKDGGSSIPVTNENKVEYVKLLSEHRLRNSVRKQMQVPWPKDAFLIFNPPRHDLSFPGILGWLS